MISDSLRSVSSDVVVISIALLGLTIGLIALLWRRFTSGFMTLSRHWRKVYFQAVFITFALPILIPLAVYTIVGVYYPSLAQNSVVLVMMLIAGILLLWLFFKGVRWVIDQIRGARKPKESKTKLDVNILICIYSVACLGLSALFSLCSLLSASSSALDIYIGQNQVENFNWARWILNDAILLFVIGVLEMAWLYMLPRRSRTN
jgi:hypothetical protein